MDFSPTHSHALVPLAYHVNIIDFLRGHEPDVWRWASARTTVAEQTASLKTMLLRDTYRIDPGAHADVHALLSTAMERLGIAAPATLYQSTGQDMNAALVHVPGEVHIILQGPVLERLAPDELLAVFGHELAHYLLWSRDDGAFLVADRILNDAVGHAGATPSHGETYRRYVLHTELFADRGSAVAAGGIAPAISALVKIQTGMANVDAAAYLRQAGEIDTGADGASEHHSHPETFIRARALSLWWSHEPELEAWLVQRLNGPLSLERLDLPGQLAVQAITRGLIARYLAGTELASEAVMSQVRLLFPDWRDDQTPLTAAQMGPHVADASVLAYFNALMMDLALADPDQQDAALLRAGYLAQEFGSLEELQVNLRRDAGFGKRELDRFKRQLAKVTQA